MNRLEECISVIAITFIICWATGHALDAIQASSAKPAKTERFELLEGATMSAYMLKDGGEKIKVRLTVHKGTVVTVLSVRANGKGEGDDGNTLDETNVLPVRSSVGLDGNDKPKRAAH